MYELRKQLMKMLEEYSKTYTDQLADVEETGDFNAIKIARTLQTKHSEATTKVNVLLDEFEQRIKTKKKMW